LNLVATNTHYLCKLNCHDLLKTVSVHLNYRIGVHMNFAQSRIPALVCSLQSEYACHHARSQGGNGEMPPQLQSFQVNERLQV